MCTATSTPPQPYVKYCDCGRVAVKFNKKDAHGVCAHCRELELRYYANSLLSGRLNTAAARRELNKLHGTVAQTAEERAADKQLRWREEGICEAYCMPYSSGSVTITANGVEVIKVQGTCGRALVN